MTTSVSFEAHHSALPVQIFSNDSEGLISRFTGLASEDGQGVTVNSRGNLTPTIQDAVLLQEINNDPALGSVESYPVSLIYHPSKSNMGMRAEDHYQ